MVMGGSFQVMTPVPALLVPVIMKTAPADWYTTQGAPVASSSREASRPPWLLVTVVMTVGTVHWLPPASVAHANRSVPASDAKNSVQGTPDTTWTWMSMGLATVSTVTAVAH